MGEVYKARDTRLSRTVAIKVLPPDVAADVAARARFEREARAIATLSHPNICTVHDVGRQDDTDYLVMELLEGETLADLLAKANGPLPLDQVLTIGPAIADALDKAHRAGIVHRDLKPANVMLTKSGPKLLDFGLAKLHGAGSPVALSDETGATTAGPATAKGTILGTIHYMAPEQVEGREADTRSDIWALGALLYEMATGQRPFEGTSPASVIGAILKDSPAPLSVLLPLSPPIFERLVFKCLAKDPDARWQSASDLAAQLEWLRHGAASETSARQAVAGHAPAGTISLKAFAAFAAVAAALVVGLVVPVGRHLRETPPSLPPETRLEISTLDGDRPPDFALSPDGSQLVYVASGDKASRLWLRSLSKTGSQPLAGTDGATFPFWSPDGRSIGFFTPTSLKRIDLAGGEPVTLAPVTVGTGGTWNADGVIVYAPTNGSTRAPLMRVAAAGGPATAVTQVADGQTGHSRPFFLPDGVRFLFTASGQAESIGSYRGGLDGRPPVRLAPSDGAGLWAPAGAGRGAASLNGWVIWKRLGTQTLVAQRLDIEKAQLTGETVVIADGVAGLQLNSRSIDAASVAGNGSIAYRTGKLGQRQLVWFDRSGRKLEAIGELEGVLRSPRISPDGRRIAVERIVDGKQDVWLLDAVRGTRFTLVPGNNGFPVWSPDGTRIVFYGSSGSGVLDLWVKSSAGTGAEQPLLISKSAKVPFSWSPDGRYLLYSDYSPETNADLWLMPLNGDGKPSLLVQSRYRETQGTFSPDGRWIAYLTDESRRAEIYVRPFVAPDAASADRPAAGAPQQISTGGGIYPAWRRDGKELYYLDPGGNLMAVPITVAGGVLEAGAPSLLFHTRIFGGGVDVQQGRNYDVASDGRFLINTLADDALAPITLIQNWNPEAKMESTPR